MQKISFEKKTILPEISNFILSYLPGGGHLPGGGQSAEV
jgi:hypothetical protein